MSEVININKFPDHDVDQDYLATDLWKDCEFVEQLTAELKLYKSHLRWFIAKDQSILGLVVISEQTIQNQTYSHIDIIYIFPEYRKTSQAIRWLIYSVKENTKYPVIVDGAIFKDGQQLIAQLSKYNWINLQILNKLFGAVEPFTKLLPYDLDRCYLMTPCHQPFGKKLFGESTMIWYNWMDQLLE